MKQKFLVLGLLVVMMAFAGQVALAAGPHDVNCVGCHNVHYAKGNYIIGVQPNTMQDNPATSGKISDIEALCLGCHNESEGIMPIHLSTTHPTGVVPSYVNVPDRLLRDGKFSCISCHNPHPANTNYKYLVVDTQKGAKMGVFCAVCHSEQADSEVSKVSQEAQLSAGPKVAARVQVASK